MIEIFKKYIQNKKSCKLIIANITFMFTKVKKRKWKPSWVCRYILYFYMTSCAKDVSNIFVSFNIFQKSSIIFISLKSIYSIIYFAGLKITCSLAFLSIIHDGFHVLENSSIISRKNFHLWTLFLHGVIVHI